MSMCEWRRVEVSPKAMEVIPRKLGSPGDGADEIDMRGKYLQSLRRVKKASQKGLVVNVEVE